MDPDSAAVTGPVVSAAEMDVGWFERILGSGGGDTRIVAVDATPIGAGQVGESIRFRLTRADGSSTSIVGKFPSDNEQSFATAQQMGIYASEVGFYRDVARGLDIRVPAVSYIGFDPATTRFCLLMEDISPAVPGDQLTGTDLATAERVIDQAVGLHAPTWGRAVELARLSWISLPTVESAASHNRLIRSLFDRFAARYRHRLAADDIELGRELMPRLDQLGAAQGIGASREPEISEALCLAHQDFRLDNMLFGTGPGAPPVTVVDWQTCRLGSGPADIAYFCGAGLDPDARRANEHHLVERYVGGLTRSGIMVDAEVIRRRYVLGSASGYLMAVLASQVVGATERGDAMFCLMAERHARQMRDLGFFDLLDQLAPDTTDWPE
ncbi:MAG: ecdysteroid 22-kinase family protein [Acidimicrobiia bacterium]|nr:ecdysteroid 22-kinase family protein [Acidimicrobiia bacterium]